MSNISGLVEHFPYVGLFLLLILGGVGLPIPEDTTLILCGFLIATEVVKPIPALVVVYVGLLLTDMGLYAVGRQYGQKIVNHRRFRKIVSLKRLVILEDNFKRRGVLYILIGRHLIGLRAQIFLTAGVMRMSGVKFLIADAVSSLLTIAIMVGAGYIGGHSLQVIKNDIRRIEHIGILLAMILLVIYLIYEYFRSRRS